ncbi:ribonuclease domain-containing protein [Cupriavidus pauculus]|jgi:ribonuclease T1
MARRLAHALSGLVLRASLAASLAASVTFGAAFSLAPLDAMARQAQSDVAAGMAGTIAVQQLPNEAQRTLERIQSGGPFPYDKDGSRFGNYERILPQQSRGYYREYTVKTNSRNRGAKRIVCGGDQRAANDCYYTEDHYNSFKRITK